MPNVEVEVEVYCASCGAGLCNQTESTVGRSRSIPQFRVEPCEKCLDGARKDGHNDGYEEGHKDGDTEGYNRRDEELAKEQESGRGNV